MSVSISVSIDTRELERIANQLDVKKHEVGRKIGPMIEKDAKAFSPVDTGALKSSINVEYPGGDILARLQTGIEYAKYQEFGTYKMAAQPFLIPAIEVNTGVFYNPDTWKVLFT